MSQSPTDPSSGQDSSADPWAPPAGTAGQDQAHTEAHPGQGQVGYAYSGAGQQGQPSSAPALVRPTGQGSDGDPTAPDRARRPWGPAGRSDYDAPQHSRGAAHPAQQYPGQQPPGQAHPWSGHPGGPQPGYPDPRQDGPRGRLASALRRRPAGFWAVAAAITGVISVVVARVPVVNVLSLFGGLAAISLGGYALWRGRWAKGTRPWRAVSGMTAGAAAIVLAITIDTIFGVSFFKALNEDPAVAGAAPAASTAPSADPGDQSGQGPADSGSDAPADLAIGEATKIGDWTVGVVDVQFNANAEVAQANQFNAPPQGQYLQVMFAAQYDGTDRGTPSKAITATYIGPQGQEVRTGPVVPPHDPYALADVRPGTVVQFGFIFDVPVGTTGGEVKVVQHGDYSLDAPAVYWDLSKTAASTSSPSPSGI